jgi:hypothetical protein
LYLGGAHINPVEVIRSAWFMPKVRAANNTALAAVPPLGLLVAG